MKVLSEKSKLSFTGIFSLLFLLFYLVILPHYDVTNLKTSVYSLDIRSSYTHEYVRWLFNTIGNEGLHQYKYFLIADFGYIATYVVLSYLILSLLIGQMGKLGQMLHLTVYTPLLLMITDVVENINTFLLIYNADEFSVGFVRFASVITTVKWFFASLLLGMIICYAFYAVLRFIFWKLRNKN